MKKICVFVVLVSILVLFSFLILQKQNSVQINKNLGNYFKDINGCAVVFDEKNNKYYFYNRDMANERVSPYSTFKVIATLIGLKNKVIQNEQSTMNYNGEKYPFAAWNNNLSLEQAFKSSCVWYYRQLINKVGKDKMEKELKEISYGNCDISEWNGNNTNPMPDSNGFWLGSSLKISPVEQVNILSKIFDNKSIYRDSDIKILKNIMLVETDRESKVYGKTGTGLNNQAWFIGFKEKNSKKYYLAVYLDDRNKKYKSGEIKGQNAREIALKIMKSFL